MTRLRGKSRKISDVKELIGKIFRTKDLASAASVIQEHARRISFAYYARGLRGQLSQVRFDGRTLGGGSILVEWFFYMAVLSDAASLG